MDAIRAQMSPEAFSGFCQGNVVKYLWRHSIKGGAEDLKKARYYLDLMIAQLEDGTDG